MTFDGTVTTGDALTITGYVGSFIWMWVRQREKLLALDARIALVEQNHDFLARSVEDHRRIAESNWVEVKRLLERITEKLDDKADKRHA